MSACRRCRDAARAQHARAKLVATGSDKQPCKQAPSRHHPTIHACARRHPLSLGVSTAPVAFNAHYVFSFAFEALNAHAAIYLEEDILPFPDALRFFLGSYELLTDTDKFVVPGTKQPGASRVFSVHSGMHAREASPSLRPLTLPHT